MLYPVNFLVLAIAAEACVDNLLWMDTFGWTCRDYTRAPIECRSNYAVSVGGIEAQEACCACVKPVERRRFTDCLGICVSDEEACDKSCLAERRTCNYNCGQAEEDDEDDETGGAVTEDDNGNGDEEDEEETIETPVRDLEWWAILLIILGVLLFICTICIVFYLLCMTRDEGTCEDDEFATQQPMLIGGDCNEPCGDNPCDTPCDNRGPQMAYDQVPVGYSQGNNQISAGYTQGKMW